MSATFFPPLCELFAFLLLSSPCKEPSVSRYSSSRKTAPKVRDGQVQKKNRHAPTRLNSLSVGIAKTRGGRRHVITKEDIWKFVRLLPDWKRLSTDLDFIYLSSITGDEDGADGWYVYPTRPMIVINAWDADLTLFADPDFFRRHEKLFERLGAEVRELEYGYDCVFDEDSARAYQLLHIFLHELGHHHYLITGGRGKIAGSEKYAETYALKMERKIWQRYCQAFHFHPENLAA